MKQNTEEHELKMKYLNMQLKQITTRSNNKKLKQQDAQTTTSTLSQLTTQTNKPDPKKIDFLVQFEEMLKRMVSFFTHRCSDIYTRTHITAICTHTYNRTHTTARKV